MRIAIVRRDLQPVLEERLRIRHAQVLDSGNREPTQCCGGRLEHLATRTRAARASARAVCGNVAGFSRGRGLEMVLGWVRLSGPQEEEG
jgi:hypothetical protein